MLNPRDNLLLKMVLKLFTSLTIGVLLQGCASSQSTRSETRREEERRRAVRAMHTVGHPMLHPSGSDQ